MESFIENMDNLIIYRYICRQNLTLPITSIYYGTTEKRFQRRAGNRFAPTHYPDDGKRSAGFHAPHYGHRLLSQSPSPLSGKETAHRSVCFHLLHQRVGMVPHQRTRVCRLLQPVFHTPRRSSARLRSKPRYAVDDLLDSF